MPRVNNTNKNKLLFKKPMQKNSRIQILLTGTKQQQLEALLNSELILKRLICSKMLEDSLLFIQKTNILTGDDVTHSPKSTLQPTAASEGKAQKKRKKKKQKAQQHDAVPLLELICRSICNNADTVEGLRHHVDSFIINTPDECKFIQLLQTVMNSYIEDTAQYLEQQLKPSILPILKKCPKECRMVLDNLHECFEVIKYSCEQIEHIIQLYFQHYNKPLRDYVGKSQYLQNGLHKLMVSRLVKRNPNIKEFVNLCTLFDNYLLQYPTLAELKNEYYRSTNTQNTEDQDGNMIRFLNTVQMTKNRLQCSFEDSWLKSLQNSCKRAKHKKNK